MYHGIRVYKYSVYGGNVMKLLIHDLSREEWKKIASEYNGWKVVADSGLIKPCVGCFGCWVKTPGQCVIKDGYDNMGALIHKAEEVVVMSRYTYGGFSGFVKNVFDRSISWVLPYFEIIDGEMHHKSRYPEEKKVTFIFRGTGISEEDKAAAEEYVKSVCRNFHTDATEILFVEAEESEEGKNGKRYNSGQNPRDSRDEGVKGKTILLNCSMRGKRANSKRILDRMVPEIQGETLSINLSEYAKKPDELKKILNSSEKIILGMPLYVDGVPSSPLRVMEMMEREGRRDGKIIYVVANMGFYESKQIHNLLGMVKRWCEKCGYTYGGGIAVGAGEMIGTMMKSNNLAKGPTANVAMGMSRLIEAVNSASVTEDIYADPAGFPRKAYMFLANMGWPRDARKNGLKKKDTFRRIELQ